MRPLSELICPASWAELSWPLLLVASSTTECEPVKSFTGLVSLGLVPDMKVLREKLGKARSQRPSARVKRQNGSAVGRFISRIWP
jgi:hypothetical protein